MIVFVYFELDLVLRGLRERLHRISLHWPRNPEAQGMIIGDFNICEPEEGRFNVRNQTFTEGDARKRLFFVLFTRMLLKSSNLISQGRTPPPMVRYAHYPEWTERSQLYPWQRREIFTAIPTFLTTWASGPYRVITLQSASLCRNRKAIVTMSSETRVGWPNILVFALF